MSTNRRGFLTATAAGLAVAGLAGSAHGKAQTRRIAIEEAFATPELVKAWLEIARADPSASLDMTTGILWIFGNSRPGSNQDRFRRKLLDLET